LAQLHGLQVVDDSDSSMICCDSLNKVDSQILLMAVKTASAIGTGLSGFDLKQVGGDYIVIQTNDNPFNVEGEVDQKVPLLYERFWFAI
jgi:glutathione synthase/RimK-type ligase-like ATP-grasp enzyme